MAPVTLMVSLLADLESGMLQAYSIAFAVGSLIGLLYLGWEIPSASSAGRRIPPPMRMGAAIIALGTGVIAARLGFVLPHGEYYANHPEQILMFWEGGLSWVGGAIGALLALMIVAAIEKNSFWSLMDAMAIPAVILAFACWFGCLLEGCSYGKAADFGLFTPLSADIFGTVAKRWPVQGSGSLLCVAAFLLLRALDHRKLAAGALGCLSLAMISAISLLLAFGRGDPVPAYLGVRLDALASGGLLALSILMLTLRAGLAEKGRRLND